MKKIVVEWLYNLLSPMTVFCGGGVFLPYQFLLTIARSQSCKNVKNFTRIESVHQIILQGLCLLFTLPSEIVDHRHPNCEVTLNCEWTEYLEFCFTSS